MEDSEMQRGWGRSGEHARSGRWRSCPGFANSSTINSNVLVARIKSSVFESSIKLVSRVRDPGNYSLRWIQFIRFRGLYQTGFGHQLNFSGDFTTADS
jgi:hypothetical protein